MKNTRNYLICLSALLTGLLGFWDFTPIVVQKDDFELEFIYWSSNQNQDGSFSLLKTSIPSGETVVFVEDDRITRIANMAWSPDGMHLAGIAMFDPHMEQSPTPNLCVFHADGTLETYFEISVPIESFDVDYNPFRWPIIWTSDNSTILFVSNVRNDGTLWISAADIENNTVQRVFENRWEDALYMKSFKNFAWSPDADKFAISIRLKDQSEAIYIVELTTGKMIELKEHDRHLTVPAWSGDGRFLSFIYKYQYPSVTKIYDSVTEETREIELLEGEDKLGGGITWSHNRYRLTLLGSVSEYDWMFEGVEQDIYICDPGQVSLQSFDCHGYGIFSSIATFYWWPHTPYWSPDDRFLILESTARYPYDPTPIVVIDLENRTTQIFGEQSRNHDPAWRPIVQVSGYQ